MNAMPKTPLQFIRLTSPGRGAVGWYVEDDASSPLTQPAGALVVNAGPGFAVNASTTIVVAW